ncbi:MAG: helix-turn-helix transcriptional regulator [Streptomyces sp.]|nr:helix-turn-helix transcriptional regulator [Streptomyces sp.]
MSTTVRSSGGARGGTRVSSDERRRQVLRHALTEFAHRGLKGATTQAIAARSGVSQPYLFRLFDSKTALFLAALKYGFDLAEAETPHPATGQDGVSARCSQFTENGEGELAMLLLQGCAAACDDEQVAELLRHRLRRLANRHDRPDKDLLTQLLHTASSFALREAPERRREDLAP